ncbi:hypothetical protein D043_4200B, partial [Vibrio parahaemolyticus EKP-021]
KNVGSRSRFINEDRL